MTLNTIPRLAGPLHSSVEERYIQMPCLSILAIVSVCVFVCVKGTHVAVRGPPQALAYLL